MSIHPESTPPRKSRGRKRRVASGQMMKSPQYSWLMQQEEQVEKKEMEAEIMADDESFGSGSERSMSTISTPESVPAGGVPGMTTEFMLASASSSASPHASRQSEDMVPTTPATPNVLSLRPSPPKALSSGPPPPPPRRSRENSPLRETQTTAPTAAPSGGTSQAGHMRRKKVLIALVTLVLGARVVMRRIDPPGIGFAEALGGSDAEPREAHRRRGMLRTAGGLAASMAAQATVTSVLGVAAGGAVKLVISPARITATKSLAAVALAQQSMGRVAAVRASSVAIAAPAVRYAMRAMKVTRAQQVVPFAAEAARNLPAHSRTVWPQFAKGASGVAVVAAPVAATVANAVRKQALTTRRARAIMVICGRSLKPLKPWLRWPAVLTFISGLLA